MEKVNKLVVINSSPRADTISNTYKALVKRSRISSRKESEYGRSLF